MYREGMKLASRLEAEEAAQKKELQVTWWWLCCSEPSKCVTTACQFVPWTASAAVWFMGVK